MAEVILCEKGTDRRVISMPLQGSNPLEVSLEVDGLSAAVIIEGQKSPEVDIRTLSTEAAGGFTGCTVGLYAVADTEKTLTAPALNASHIQKLCKSKISYYCQKTELCRLPDALGRRHNLSLLNIL